MTFRRIFANTNPAPTLAAGRARALTLYREWLREYPLEISLAEGRGRVRAEFERFRNINDLNMLNIVLLKGTQELIETHNKWKQKTHVMRYFEGEWEETRTKAHNPLLRPVTVASLPTTSPFLSNFLTNRQ